MPDNGAVCFCGHPIPVHGCVLWCDCCIDEWLANERGETMTGFIARKRREAAERSTPGG